MLVSTELMELIITQLHSYTTCRVCRKCQPRITGSNYV